MLQSGLVWWKDCSPSLICIYNVKNGLAFAMACVYTIGTLPMLMSHIVKGLYILREWWSKSLQHHDKIGDLIPLNVANAMKLQ